MSDHHRYYKDSYGSSSSSKRYHSPSDVSRLGGLSGSGGGGGDYYDTSDSRSKRTRTDGYESHTSSSRYADYSASSSSGGSRYKPAASSSSYYDLQGYKPSSSSSSSSSKYLDDYKGSGGGSSSRSALKSNVRRVPPPLTPPCLSSKSSSTLRLQPLMKVSVSSSSSSGVGSSSGKDYYGSRMRQAPPEHHYSYSASGSHSHNSSSSYSKAEFKRPPPVSYRSSKSGTSSSGYHHSVPKGHGSASSSSSSYRSGTIASRKLAMARSRAPLSSGVSSRMRGRSTLMSSRPSRRDDDFRRRKIGGSMKREYKRSRSGSGSRDERTKTKDKKEQEQDVDTQESQEKKQDEHDSLEFANMTEGQIVVDEVAGDDEEDDGGVNSEAVVDGNSSTVSTDKTEGSVRSDGQQKEESHVKESLGSTADGKNDKEDGKSTQKDSEDKSYGSRALLKLHCPYCDVRCISFREFTFHLKSMTHTRTMSNVVSEMKKKLIKVRHEMKDDQRKREKAEKVLSDTSSYCRVCELSFRTDPKEHEANEIHNKIKTLIYRRCDVCNIDFRIWKVHIYHMAALEHAKRVAMKELQEREATGDNVKGTNLSPAELGLNLVEIRTVFYCNACIRYIPIKGEEDEAKKNHCMTLNHLKSVEEFNERERRRAIREEARERAARRRKQEEEEKEDKANANKDSSASGGTEKKVEGNEADGKAEANSSNTTNNGGVEEGVQIKVEIDTCDEDTGNEKEDEYGQQDNEAENKMAAQTNSANDEHESNQNEAEDEDDDEIELHARDDVEVESEDTGDWSRRTRSSQRGDGSSK